MSELGHERRSERLPISSDLPAPTDIDAPTRLVRFVPNKRHATFQKAKFNAARGAALPESEPRIVG